MQSILSVQTSIADFKREDVQLVRTNYLIFMREALRIVYFFSFFILSNNDRFVLSIE